MTNNQPARYRIFLLTFWLDDECDRTEADKWRFRLEEPKSGYRQGCVGMDALMERFINEIMFAQAELDGECSDDSSSAVSSSY